MNGPSRSQPRRDSGSRAFTLIEATISMLIVGGLFAAALNTVGSFRTSRLRAVQRSRGLLLAHDLMSEILQQYYEDPATPGSFGHEAGESASVRADFDDVDDYDGWTRSPPENRDGQAIPACQGYARQVTVEWVGPSDLDVVSSSATGVKRIKVEVIRGDRPVARLTAFRTEVWLNPADGRETSN